MGWIHRSNAKNSSPDSPYSERRDSEPVESCSEETPEKTKEEKHPRKSYKERTPLAVRMAEANTIMTKYPHQIPVVVERFRKEKVLPELSKTKFLAPRNIMMSQFISIIRSRLQLPPNKSLYLLIDNKAIVSLTLTMEEVYKEHRDRDGFVTSFANNSRTRT